MTQMTTSAAARWREPGHGPMRLRPLRRSPLTFGRMAKRPIPRELTDGWLAPFTQRAVRRDLAKYIRAVDKGRLLDAAAKLTGQIRSFVAEQLPASDLDLGSHRHGASAR